MSDQAATWDRLQETVKQVRSETARVIVGQDEIVEQLLTSLLCKGHCLLVGVPGLAKTLLVSTIAKILGLKFQRIQFTPDLMPTDIVGSEILQTTHDGDRKFQYIPGPIFANLILADEINRTPPKTQAALLEAMQEHQVTAAGTRHPLPEPFFVLATQNPIEMEGTYALPEAQLDRFLFNVVIDYLPEADEVKVVQRTTAGRPPDLQPVFSGDDVLAFHALVRQVPVSEEIVASAVRLAAASRPHQPGTPDFINDWVNWGAGTRAAQALVLGSKARALLKGRAHVTLDDLHALALPVLRHRILLNYRAEAEGIRIEDVIRRLLEERR